MQTRPLIGQLIGQKCDRMCDNTQQFPLEKRLKQLVQVGDNDPFSFTCSCSSSFHSSAFDGFCYNTVIFMCSWHIAWADGPRWQFYWWVPARWGRCWEVVFAVEKIRSWEVLFERFSKIYFPMFIEHCNMYSKFKLFFTKLFIQWFDFRPRDVDGKIGTISLNQEVA